MSIVEEVINRTGEIPVVLDGTPVKLGDLKRGTYDTTLKSLDENGGNIYLGKKTGQGIGFQLFYLHIFDKDSLDFLGYEVHAKSLSMEAAR